MRRVRYKHPDLLNWYRAPASSGSTLKLQLQPLRQRLVEAARAVKAALLPARGGATDAEIAERAREFAPVVWLLGKVQSGKTSLIRVMTGCSAAEIGNGFKACTRSSRIFDFPEEAPLIRFLDTRGLGEAGYDAAEDLAVCERQSHLVVVTMRALDPQQEAIVDVVHAIRRRHPEWPIIVAQTTLHEGYPVGRAHVLPYPFKEHDPTALAAAGVSSDLARSLARQRALFAGVPGQGVISFVPVDFTLPEDGWQPADYGYDVLIETLQSVAPGAVVSALEDLHGETTDRLASRAHPHILGYATAAAGADLWPVAGAALVPAIQGKLLHTLGSIYGIKWNRRALSEFLGALGATTLLRVASGFGARELAKLVPVYGQTAGAAAAAVMSFAMTYALGKAACHFLGRRRAGARDPGGVAQTYKYALAAALRLARERGFADPQRRKAP
jgi:uncharacterized protein (DUF697 family)